MAAWCPSCPRKKSCPSGLRCPGRTARWESSERAVQPSGVDSSRSEEHTSELQSLRHLVCRLLLEKKAENASRTLGVIIALLILMLAGIPYLVRVYGIAATDPGAPGYQSVLFFFIAAVAPKCLFYSLTSGSTL